MFSFQEIKLNAPSLHPHHGGMRSVRQLLSGVEQPHVYILDLL